MNPSAPPSRPRLWQRLTISLLALAGVTLALWPSAPFTGEPFYLQEPWVWNTLLLVGNAVAVVAGSLALLLAWRAAHPAAIHLAASLALAVTAVGASTLPVLPVPGPVLSAVAAAAAALALAGLTRFSALYPHPFQPTEPGSLEAILRSERGRLPLERGTREVGGVLGRRAPEWSRRIASWVRQTRDRLARAAPRLFRPVPGLEATRARGLAFLAEHAWGFGVGIAGVAILKVLASTNVLEVLALLAAVITVPVLLSATWALLRVSYATGDEADRRKVLWIAEGFTLLIFIPGLLSYAMLAMGVFGSADFLVLWLQLTYIGAAIGSLLLVICLAIAVFGAGALDPAKTLRSTVAYGALGMVLTLVFAGMEEVASDYLVAWVGLPGDTAVWLSTGVAALAFSALHRRFERAASGLFRESEAEAPPAGTLHARSPMPNTGME